MRGIHILGPLRLRGRTDLAPAVLTLMVVTVAVLPGCSLGRLRPGVEVVVKLPPAAWDETGISMGHRLVFPNAQGEIEELWLPAGVSSAAVRVRRGYNVPILAYPLGRLRPSGACSTEHGQCELGRLAVPLRFRHGPAAQAMLELQSLAERCETVHLEALTLELEAEGEGDPWKCDLERVKSAIVRGRLNRLQVCNLDSLDLTVELPAGDWIAGNSLWNGTVRSESADEGGSDSEFLRVEFSGLYPGRHCFYSPASGLELHLYVDKKGGCRWVCDSLSAFSE